MDLNNLLKLAGLAAQLPEANTTVGDSVPGKANTRPDPKVFPDGPSNLGSVSDTSLRRYLKAKGQPVSVEETTYPDYSVEEVLESYVTYTAEKAKNPYAIGMASAMKSTGDKPPLKKSTINKAHKIAKGIGESSLNEAEGTYARVIYDYSEDFGMITLYDNGNKIDEWSGYFGADTVGNPLADKFVEIAKKNGLNPEGMNIVDDEGEKGTFGNNTFNWDQFATDETGMNESITEGYISELKNVLKNSGQLLNEAGGIGGGMSGGKFGGGSLSNLFNKLTGNGPSNYEDYPSFAEITGKQPAKTNGAGIKGLEPAPWKPGDHGAPGDVAVPKVNAPAAADKPFILGRFGNQAAVAEPKAPAIAARPEGPAAGMPQRQKTWQDSDFQAGGARPEGPAAGMPAAPKDPGMMGRGLPANTPRVGGKSATITPPVSRPNVGGARPEGPAAAMPKAPPQPASFKDAFRAARKAAGGAGGVFMWKGKPYQTNIKGEPALPSNSKDLKKVGNWSASESTSVVSDAVNEAVAKIACTKCDEVSTAAAWNKNHDTCPKCKTSKQGVAEAATPGNKSFEVHYTTSAGTNRVIKVNAASKKAAQDKVAGRKDFGSLHKIVEPKKTNEAAKPDFLDMDKDGDKKEPMKKALKDKEKVSESISYLKKLAGL